MNTQYLQVWKRVAALGILAVGMATPALAQKTVSRSFAMPGQVNAMMSMTGCQNAPGPQITMEGEISLGGLTVEMLFRNNVKGTHTYTVQNAVEVEAVAADSTMEGSMSLDTGMKGRFIFPNNDNPVGGPHATDRTVDVTLAPAGASMKFPKQPVLGGVGGNPLIYAQFLQGDDTPIGSEALLGRCVQLAPGN